ncbi:MAG: HAD-IIIC family phosphatase [Actinomycetota bacterium]
MPTPAEIARTWRTHRAEITEPALTVGVAGSFTIEPIEAYLGMGLVESGVGDPAFRFADYNQLHQLCLDPTGTLGGAVDTIVAMMRLEDVFSGAVERYLDGDDTAAPEIIDGAAELATMLVNLASTGTPVVLGLPPVPAPWGTDAGDGRTSIRLARLHAAVLGPMLDILDGAAAISLVDTDAVLRSIGHGQAHDDTKWALYRQPYTSAAWHALGDSVAEVVTRTRIAAPKVLVLDCDNTLWGGVIGEDGIAGIELGDTFPGSSFTTFQRRIKQYKEAGVMLAIASKNDEPAVREVFEKHDAMVLEPDDIACWKVNWLPKSQNIREIAAELNVGVDSLVFVDDSHFEVAEVRNAVPEVRVLQVPEEPTEIPGLIGRSGLFRHLKVSAEDRERTKMMLAEGARKQQQDTLSPEDFLASLGLTLEYFEPGDDHIARVAQLTNKTNQFNLTTIRRTEGDISRLIGSDDHEVRAIRVSDRFGDYGIVGVAIMERAAQRWAIDSFLMSCRVLGRGVETALLASIAEDARNAGAEVLEGRYVETIKNGQVADFYQRHGFAGDDGVYEADTDTIGGPSHVAVVR